jgi:phosphoadenosine phosphosulfate reductase
MKTILQIKENIEYFVRGKKAILLLTGDKGSSLLFNIVREMKMRSVFIDTGYHFTEIVSHVEDNNNIDCVRNHDATAEGSDDMQKCCGQRKGDALRSYLSSVEAECLIVPFTAEEKKFGVEDSFLNDIKNIAILKPLYDLTEGDIWTMIREHDMPFSSLYNKGFKIIDCECCTTRIGRTPPSDEKSKSDLDEETVDKLKSLGYM